MSTQRLLSLLRPAYDADIDVDRMLALDRDGDTGVRRVLSDAGRTIGRALADLCTSLNPAVIVVGGSLGSSEALVDGVRASVDRYAQPDAAAAVRVASGRLGDRAGAHRRGQPGHRPGGQPGLIRQRLLVYSRTMLASQACGGSSQ